MPDRPVIGICAAVERARWGHWEDEAVLLPRAYSDAVRRGGGLALLLPPDPEVTADPGPMLDLLDGLLLAGGADVDPSSYGADRHPRTVGTSPERDAFEMSLARAAMDRDLPMLAICRGMQVLNVALGGSLHQHVPDVVGHEEHRRKVGSFEGSEHDVELEPASLAARAAGETRHSTKSHHHQGVDVLGEGLRATGRSTLDELVEAIEAPDRRWALGVQWHPEADERSRLVAALVAEAREARDSRG